MVTSRPISGPAAAATHTHTHAHITWQHALAVTIISNDTKEEGPTGGEGKEMNNVRWGIIWIVK
jgi:hypothetical protein